jgi:heptosyltransferase-1
MHFLIVKTSSLGDIVQSFDLLVYLKTKFPNCLIDWVVERRCSEILKAHPYVNNVIEIDSKKLSISELKKTIGHLRAKKYDVVFDIQANIKSGIVLFFTKAKEKVGFKKVAEWPNLLFTTKKMAITEGLNIRQDYVNVAKMYFGDQESLISQQMPLLKILEKENEAIDDQLKVAKDKIKILVAPGSRWDNKCLDRGRLLAFLKSYSSKAFFFLSHGSDSDLRDCIYIHEHIKEQSCLLPKSSLASLQNMMSKVDLVIAVDSLPLHLAATTNVKTLSFFGPSSLKKFAPQGANHTSFQGQCPFKVAFEKRCPKLRKCDFGDCTKDLNPLVLMKKKD